jgi:hypothetical protein
MEDTLKRELRVDFWVVRRNTLWMLLLKRHLVDLVRAGKKRQTIRLWSRAMLSAGQISYTPGLGRMKITAVDVLPSLGALTEADARADGFDSLAALLDEIRRIYGDKPLGRTIFRIKFEWPIDEAGKKLVLAPASSADPAKRMQSRVSEAAPSRSMKSSMTPAQRRALRTFVLAHAPR